MICPPVSTRWHCLEDNYVIFHTPWIVVRLLLFVRHFILVKWALCSNGKCTCNCHKRGSVSASVCRNHSESFESFEKLHLLQRGAPSSLSAVLIQSALSYIRVNMFLRGWSSLSAGLDWQLVLLQSHRLQGTCKIEVINCANSTVCSFSNQYWSSTNWGFNI